MSYLCCCQNPDNFWFVLNRYPNLGKLRVVLKKNTTALICSASLSIFRISLSHCSWPCAPGCLCKWQRGAFGSEAEKICGKPFCLALKWKRSGSCVADVVSNVKSHLPKGTSDFPPYAFSTWSRLLVMEASWSLHWICIQLCFSADVALESNKRDGV